MAERRSGKGDAERPMSDVERVAERRDVRRERREKEDPQEGGAPEGRRAGDQHREQRDPEVAAVGAGDERDAGELRVRLHRGGERGGDRADVVPHRPVEVARSRDDVPEGVRERRGDDHRRDQEPPPSGGEARHHRPGPPERHDHRREHCRQCGDREHLGGDEELRDDEDPQYGARERRAAGAAYEQGIEAPEDQRWQDEPREIEVPVAQVAGEERSEPVAEPAAERRREPRHVAPAQSEGAERAQRGREEHRHVERGDRARRHRHRREQEAEELHGRVVEQVHTRRREDGVAEEGVQAGTERVGHPREEPHLLGRVGRASREHGAEAVREQLPPGGGRDREVDGERREGGPCPARPVGPRRAARACPLEPGSPQRRRCRAPRGENRRGPAHGSRG